jgi:hypothetical protein
VIAAFRERLPASGKERQQCVGTAFETVAIAARERTPTLAFNIESVRTWRVLIDDPLERLIVPQASWECSPR